MGKLIKVMIAVLAVLIAGIGVLLGFNTGRNIAHPVAYIDLIEKYSAEHELDKYLVMAVIRTESRFIPDAHSGKASGLMQLTDDTAEWICDRRDMDYSSIDLMDPETNIDLGCYYLKYLIEHYDGNIDTALAAYNGGMGNVAEWLDDERYSNDGETLYDIPFPETKDYVKKVNDSWAYYKETYSGT